MTRLEKNEIESILTESFSYFVQQHYIQESVSDKMRYYIRDKINLRIAETTQADTGFGRIPDNLGDIGRTELFDI